ncbi:hypothetical protein Hanom_Chr01g00078251 [Helianthus anomalus]
MVRVRHFEFLCRSHNIEPTVERFRAFYQLIRNMGFYSFVNWGSAKKIILNPPKSFHVWKHKFFFIREEVIPIAMIFHAPNVIEKEELPIPKGEAWYLKLTAMPNRIFGENVLLAAQMSDQWPTESKEVPVLKFQDREARLYHAAFPTFGGSMGVRPLEPRDLYWYERIKGHFLYPPAGAFANPPITTECTHLPNPISLRAVTSTEKEILYLSSEESVNGELISWSNIFAVITIDAEPSSKKGGGSRTTVGASDKGTHRFRQSNLDDYVVASDSLEGLSRIDEKKTGAAGSKSSGSAGSRNPDAGVIPSSIALDEDEEEEEEEHAVKLISRKRIRDETAKTPEKKGVEFKDPKKPAQKKTKFVKKPLKTAELEVKNEKKKTAEEPIEKEKTQEKEKVAEKPEGDSSKETGAATAIAHEKAQGPEVVRITGLDQPLHEKQKETARGKGPEVVKPTKHVHVDAPTQTSHIFLIV